MPRAALSRIPELEGLAAALAGGALFAWFGFSAAWLSGATLAACAYALAGGHVILRRGFVDAGLFLTGAGIGATVTPGMLAAVRAYPLSLAMLALTMAAVMAAQYFWLTRVHGWTRGTAVLASAPGALSAVIAAAISARLDVPRVALIQSVRVAILMAILPPMISVSGLAGAAPVPVVANPPDFALMTGVGLACAVLFERFGFNSSLFLGALAGSAGLHLTGLVSGQFPPLLTNASFMLIGMFIASRLSGFTFRALKALALTSVSTFVVALAVAAAGAFLASKTLGVPFAQMLVSYSPGGFEAMIALSAALGLDPLFSGSHHMSRFLGIAFLLPLIMRLTGTDAPPLEKDNSP